MIRDIRGRRCVWLVVAAALLGTGLASESVARAQEPGKDRPAVERPAVERPVQEPPAQERPARLGRGRRGPGNDARMRDDGAPKVGEKAPVFEIDTLDRKKKVDLAAFRGKRPVVLIFGSYT